MAGDTDLKRMQTVINRGVKYLDDMGLYQGRSGALQKLRAVAGLKQMSREEEREQTRRQLALMAAGYASQLMTLDEETGKPTIGTRPGVIDETLSLPAGVANLAGADVESESLDRADALTSAIFDEMQEYPPEGFLDNMWYGAGAMAAQIPLGGLGLYEKLQKVPFLGRVAKPKTMLGKVATAPVELMMPIIDPKLENYLVGTLASGAIPAAVDYVTRPDEEDELIDTINEYGGQ